jgi:hypothetical protein
MHIHYNPIKVDCLQHFSHHPRTLYARMDGPVPDYYTTLGVNHSATADEIRQAYKRESLRAHPDRFPQASDAERQRYTARFQSLADAYYVLSDTTRRAEYDSLRRSHGFTSSARPSARAGASASSATGAPPGGWEEFAEKEQQSSFNFFKNFFSHASDGAGASSTSTGATGTAQPQADFVFGDVFEELLRPEVHRVAPIWKMVGSASGAGLGFILGNIPGAIGGALLGNRLGAIRDAKGKSVAEVFISLGANQRAEVLKALAMKVLGSMG